MAEGVRLLVADDAVDTAVRVDAEVVREELRPVRGGREAEHGRVLQVSDVEVARGRERQTETDPARRRHLLERGAVGLDAEDLSALAAAPDTSVGGHRDALGM